MDIHTGARLAYVQLENDPEIVIRGTQDEEGDYIVIYIYEDYGLVRLRMTPEVADELSSKLHEATHHE
jgi:hypothetical protein